MIHYVTGDLLLTSCSAIAHGVAPFDDFKQGLALSLREQWPSLYKDFRHYCQTQHPSSGGLWTWKGAGGPFVINLMTQEGPSNDKGRPGRASEPHVNHALKALKSEVQRLELKRIALPRLATGVGGLDWATQVKPLMEKSLSDLKIPVFVYESYVKGQKANES
jgi:O-acetyl-ADP-ribose deacetylase (regulator of RNase III)